METGSGNGREGRGREEDVALETITRTPGGVGTATHRRKGRALSVYMYTCCSDALSCGCLGGFRGQIEWSETEAASLTRPVLAGSRSC